MNETKIFTNLHKKYKSTYIQSSFDISRHLFILFTTIYFATLVKNHFLFLFLSVLCGLLNIKTFIIFHDCIHNSYTPNFTINYFLSIVTGTFVFVSPNWGIDHLTHHLTNGNIENKHDYPFNEMILYTVNQYHLLEPRYKKWVRWFHHPVIFFTIQPIKYFLFLQRFIYIYKIIKQNLFYRHSRDKCSNKIQKNMKEIIWNDTIHNLLVFSLLNGMYQYKILGFYMISSWFTHVCIFIIFHNQHTFNPAYVVSDEVWNGRDSGLIGSSFILVPWFLTYFTSGIEYHHIHHVNAKIPCYNIHLYHKEFIEYDIHQLSDSVVYLTCIDCYNNLWLRLYNEKQQKYISFEDVKPKIDYTDRKEK